MDVDFKNDTCKKLYADRNFTNGLEVAVIRSYRIRMQALFAASNINDLLETRFLHLKKCKNKQNCYEMILDNKCQLLIEFIKDDQVNIIDILNSND